MEASGGRQKDSQASSEESDSTEQATDDTAGTGRSYECIFCKRGFSTAQALGGHMNIHRKDRARMRQTPTATKHEEEHSESYGYNPYQNHHNHRSFCPPVSESLKNYSMYFPASTSGVRDQARSYVGREDDGVGSRRPRELSLFGDDLCLGLGMHVDGRRVGSEEKRKEEEVEVDLELRLGHEP